MCMCFEKGVSNGGFRWPSVSPRGPWSDRASVQTALVQKDPRLGHEEAGRKNMVRAVSVKTSLQNMLSSPFRAGSLDAPQGAGLTLPRALSWCSRDRMKGTESSWGDRWCTDANTF